MKPAPSHPRERERIARLKSYEILDTGFDEKFDRLTRLAASLLGTPIATITLVDSDRQWFKSRVGLDGREGPRETSFCGHAILGPGLMVVEDASKDERFADNPLVTGEPHIRFYAGAPLVDKDGLELGTLCVIDRKPRVLADDERRILADLAGMAVDEMDLHRNLRDLRRAHTDLRVANKRLEILAASDALTGLANRRAFDAAMALELGRAGRAGSPFSLLLVDADHFKKYNDHYGHQSGDACLKAIALVLKSALRRPADLAARYGGEEFALLLPDTDNEGAAAVAESVRAGVSALHLPHAQSPFGRVTVSIGVATIVPRKRDKACALVEPADKALYRAKAQGRDTVCSADEVELADALKLRA